MKQKIFTWALYDFANSFVSITFLIYFSKWMVVEHGLADWLYNGTFTLGSIALIFAAPFLGRKADHLGFGRKYLIHSTVLSFVSFGLTLVGAVMGWSLYLVAALFTMASFFYQLSFVFYNPLLGHISTVTNRGKISAIGCSSNYAGQFAAILLSIPLVAGKIDVGIDPLLAPLCIGTAVFILLSLPLLFSKQIFVKADIDDDKSTEEESHRVLLRRIMAIPPLFFFLLAFFFFSDAVTTFITNFSIFASNVFTTSNEQIGVLVLGALVMAGIGAFVFGWLADRVGSVKVMAIILMLWIVGVSVTAVAPNYHVFFALVMMAGVLAGGTWAVARTLLMFLTPSSMTNYVFGLYAISERAATILGPVVWSLVLAVGGYRWALFSLAGFQVISVYLVFRVLQSSGAKPIIVD
jgi:MFS transporter, UMF1 family